jgi:PQQ-dependent dehydrogenase (methanol/ethanol family)
MSIVHNRRRYLGIAVFLLCGICSGLTFAEDQSSSLSKGAGLDQARLIHADSDAENWLMHGRTYNEQRFSPLSQINTETVGALGLDWFFDTDSQRELEATPIVIDGRMYITGAWSVVYALDARTGALLWKYDPQVPKTTLQKTCCGPVNRGVAVWHDKVLVGTLDGRLLALSVDDGTLLWSTVTVDQSKDYTITGAPRVVNGKVFIGNGGGEFGVRGYISAYDVETGKMIWRFYTVPGNPADGFESKQMAEAARTWTGHWWDYGGGGTVWDSMAYDPDLDLLYFGVGNGSPWNRRIRSPQGGDNLFLSSVVAVRPDTGEYVWHYQETPAESWDYTATQHIILADIEWQGHLRKVILHAPKNGFFFVIDRKTGELLSAEPYVEVNWASHYDLQTGRPVETRHANWVDGESMIRPAAIGAHNWMPMAYHPGLKLVYIPANNLVQTYQDSGEAESFSLKPGHWNTGNNFNEPMPFDDPRLFQAVLDEALGGELIAWDPEKQQAVWRERQLRPGNGGVLATAGDLVFQGKIDGTFVAHDAQTGRVLWRTGTQVGIIAPPISYSIEGEQYITVLTGRGGPASIMLGFEEHADVPQKMRVLTYRLGSNTSLPALPDAAASYDPPDLYPESSVLEQGRSLFNNYCARCHGMNAVSNQIAPDLRQLHPLWHDQFVNVVLNGSMASAGMPSFAGVLNKDQVFAVQHYVLEQGRWHRDLKGNAAWWEPVLKSVYHFAARWSSWVLERI